MTDYMKLSEILLDELPEEHPWKGNIKGLVETLIANGVTIQKHGRWLKTRESVGWGEFDCVECSNCHQTWIMGEDYEFDDFGYWKFCPNCGAIMDGDGNG